MLQMWRVAKPYTLLVEVESSTATLGSVWRLKAEVEHMNPYTQAPYNISGHTSKGLYILAQQCLFTHIH